MINEVVCIREQGFELKCNTWKKGTGNQKLGQQNILDEAASVQTHWPKRKSTKSDITSLTFSFMVIPSLLIASTKLNWKGRAAASAKGVLRLDDLQKIRGAISIKFCHLTTWNKLIVAMKQQQHSIFLNLLMQRRRNSTGKWSSTATMKEIACSKLCVVLLFLLVLR